MVKSPTDRSPLVRVLRSPVLWIAAVVCFITSPALFASTLVVGLVVTLVGLVLRPAKNLIWPLALGIGMILGSTPYLLSGLSKLIMG